LRFPTRASVVNRSDVVAMMDRQSDECWAQSQPRAIMARMSALHLTRMLCALVPEVSHA
jgi:hypothetical protein